MNEEMVRWLVTCPVSDGNFKYRLKNATEQDIMQAARQVYRYGAAKSKLQALHRELKKRGYKAWADYEPFKPVDMNNAEEREKYKDQKITAENLWGYILAGIGNDDK